MMKLVTDISSVTNAYNFAKGFKKSFNTNCFLTTEQFNKLIRNGVLFEITIREVAFLIKKNEGFFNLYYYASSIDELSLAMPHLLAITGDDTLVVDIVTKNELCEEKRVFEEHRFNIYTSLIRMSYYGNNHHLDGSNSTAVRNATPEDTTAVMELLTFYFDPRAEQLPDMEELTEWIRNSNIILFEKLGKVAGFIIYDLKPKTLYLRYWFVHPDYRDLKIGSHLFKEFLSRGKDTQRKMFWVIRTNQNAINRYLHYGFKEENMYNFVFVNKNLKYEN